MTLIRVQGHFITNILVKISRCNVQFLSSGLYRRYWILTSSALSSRSSGRDCSDIPHAAVPDARGLARHLCDAAVTTGVDFHHALKQIADIYSQQREYIALA